MIDNLDKRILQLLETDARQSKSAIARQLNIGKTLVTYRINRLHKQGVIKGYQFITNQARLGRVSYGILIRFQDLLLAEQEAIVRQLKATKTFDWISITTGSWDVMAVVVASDIAACNKRLNTMFAQYGEYIRDYNFYIDYAGAVASHDYLYTQPYSPAVGYGELVGGRVVVDELDQKIMKLLNRDATVSLLRVADRLDKSFDTIQSHFRSLTARGILLKAVPVIDHELLGYSNTICFMKLKPNALRMKDFIDFCMSHPNIVRQAKCLGHFNMVLNIHSLNSRQLKEIIGVLDKRFSDIVISHEFVNTIATS